MNQLKVNQQQTIVSLHEQGWSKRKIARELVLDRATARKYLAGSTPESPIPHPGSGISPESKPPTRPYPGSPAHPLLNKPRRCFQEISHRSRYWKGRPRNYRGLN
jgi:hypothetical protein